MATLPTILFCKLLQLTHETKLTLNPKTNATLNVALTLILEQVISVGLHYGHPQ